MFRQEAVKTKLLAAHINKQSQISGKRYNADKSEDRHEFFDHFIKSRKCYLRKVLCLVAIGEYL